MTSEVKEMSDEGIKTTPQGSTPAEEPLESTPTTSKPLCEQHGSIRWVIDNFSRESDKIYSNVFSTGEGSWRVIVYPRGNKSEDLSLYLDSVKSTLIPPRVAKKAHFTLSIVNQLDPKKSFLHSFTNVFNKVDQSWGWTTGTVRLVDIMDETKGFKINDQVIVECHVQVVVLDEPAMLKDDDDIFLYEQEGAIRFPITNFTKFEDKKILFSDGFMSGDRKWKLSVYPKGNDSEDLSLYLEASEPPQLPCSTTRKALFVLAIENQLDLKRSFRQTFSQYFTKSQSSWGLTTGTVKLDTIAMEESGWMSNDTVIVAGHVQMATRAFDYCSRRETGYVGVRRGGGDKTHLNIHDFNCSRICDRLAGLLQDLFFCSPIRKAVFDTPSESGSFMSELQKLFFGLQSSDIPVSADALAACVSALPRTPSPTAGFIEWASVVWNQLESSWIGRPQYSMAMNCLGHVGSVAASDLESIKRGTIRVTLQENGSFDAAVRTAVTRAKKRERVRSRDRRKGVKKVISKSLTIPDVVHVFVTPSTESNTLGRCEFPDLLNIEELSKRRRSRVEADEGWMSDDDSEPGVESEYELCGVMVSTSDKGCRHFIKIDGLWYKFEAGYVVRVSEHDAISSNYGGNGFTYTLAGSPYTCKPRLPASLLIYTRVAKHDTLHESLNSLHIPPALSTSLYDTTLARVPVATSASVRVVGGKEVIDFTNATTFSVPRYICVSQFCALPAIRADIAPRRLHYWVCRRHDGIEKDQAMYAAPYYALTDDDDDVVLHDLLQVTSIGLFVDIEPCAACLKSGVNDPVLGKFTAKDRSSLSIYRKSVKLDRLRLGQSAVHFPLLHLAAAEADARCVQQMVRSGMDVLIRHYAYRGCSPLHMAAEKGRKQIVSALCEIAQLYPQVEPPVRGHPLLNATPPSAVDMSVTAAVDTVDIDGETPLHYAVNVGHLGSVDALLDHGAPVNLPDRYGNTALHNAAKNDNEAIAIALIHRGGDRYLENDDGKTPLDLANKDLKQVLRSASIEHSRPSVSTIVIESEDDDTLIALLANDVAGTNGKKSSSKKKSKKRKKKGKSEEERPPSTTPHTTTDDKRLNDLADELMSLKTQIGNLNELVPELEAEIEQLKAENNRLKGESDIEDLKAENSELRRIKGLTELANVQLKHEIEQLRTEMGLGSIDAVIAAEHSRLRQDNERLSASLRQAVAQLHTLRTDNERLNSTLHQSNKGWQVV